MLVAEGLSLAVCQVTGTEVILALPACRRVSVGALGGSVLGRLDLLAKTGSPGCLSAAAREQLGRLLPWRVIVYPSWVYGTWSLCSDTGRYIGGYGVADVVRKRGSSRSWRFGFSLFKRVAYGVTDVLAAEGNEEHAFEESSTNLTLTSC